MTKKGLNKRIRNLVKKNRIRRQMVRILSVLCLLVCASTVLFLMRPVITLTNNTYCYEDDYTKVTVVLPDDTSVPCDALLTVTKLTEDDNNYLELYEKAKEAVDGEVSSIFLYDVSFYYNDDYLPVDDRASVSIEFKDNIIESTDGNITVLHYQGEMDPVILDLVESNSNEENVITDISFDTQGFSIFAVVSITDNPVYGNIDIDNVEIANNSFYIISAQSNASTYYELGYKTSTNTMSGKSFYGLKMESSLNTLWAFEPAEGETNKFYLSTATGATKYYIKAGEYCDNAAASVAVTTDESEKTLFTLTRENMTDKTVFLSFVANGKTYYLNTFGGVGHNTFGGYFDSDGGSKMYLLGQQGETIKTLDGKKFAIVNGTANRQLSTIVGTANSYNGLVGTSVSISERDGVKYVSGDAVLWQFHAVDAENGIYKISTTVESETKYLRLLEYRSGGEGSATLTTNLDDATAVTVEKTGTDNKVFIRYESNTYLNCDNGTNVFWSGAGKTGDYSKHYLCEELSSSGLMYNLNAPSGNWEGSAPTIGTVIQEIDGSANLQSVSGGNLIGTFDLRTHNRNKIINYYNTYNSNLAAEGKLNEDTYLTPGKQYRFDGWELVYEGKTYLFSDNAVASANEDYSFTISEGLQSVTVPVGTVLSGKWTELPGEIVMFFVNFGDTMLETQDKQPIVGYGSSYYTEVAAIGHIYNPKEISVGRESDRDLILKTNDTLIQAEIVSEYDTSSTESQIVIDAIIVVDGSTTRYEKFSGANQNILEDKIINYLRNNPNSDTAIKIDDADVDKSMILSENYKLYWYLQKYVGGPDAYHIDGVLVAKTYEMEIYKVFNGLSSADDPDILINSMTFPLGLIDINGNEDSYTTLIANTSKEGVYSYDGRQGTNSIYKWSLQSIIGQKYTFKEEGYNFTDTRAKFVSSIIKVNYTDGTNKTIIGTDKTYDGTDLFADKPLTGSQVSSVIFQNYYTNKGMGSFAIKKVSSENNSETLSGAVFELKDSTNTVIQTRTTKEDGSAYFNDMDPGTYTLTESGWPGGYQEIAGEWTVTVDKSVTGEDATVKVYIRKSGESESKNVLLFDTSDKGIKQLYEIENVPKNTTVVVNKYFEGISSADLKAIYGNSKTDGTDPYYIELLKNDSGTYTSIKKLFLKEAKEIVGATGYTWTIDEVDKGDYKLVEHNYYHTNYKDVTVSATVKTGSVTDLKDIVKDNDAKTAEFIFTKLDSTSSEVIIKNSYINSFTLQLNKIIKGSDTPIAGVTFKTYSPLHSEATSSEIFTYIDDGGISRTVYYVGSFTTDATGVGKLDGLKISDDSNEYQYILTEASVPDGYIKLDKPIVINAKIGGENYFNGIYKLKVENTAKSAAKVTVNVKKIWGDSDTHPTINIQLYRSAGGVTELYKTQSLSSGVTEYNWNDLEYQDSSGNRYEYYIKEEKVIGYSISYSNPVTINYGSDELEAGLCDGTDLIREAVITNTKGFVLPKTGGEGAEIFYFSGMVILLISTLLMHLNRKRE